MGADPRGVYTLIEKRSGILKAVSFLIITGLAGQLRILYLEDRLFFKGTDPDPSAGCYCPGAKDFSSGIYVYVGGGVARPGLYLLDKGSTGLEAVKAAGGFDARACRDSFDGGQVISRPGEVIVPLKEGFFSRMGFGKSPPVSYIIPPPEEIEVSRAEGAK